MNLKCFIQVMMIAVGLLCGFGAYGAEEPQKSDEAPREVAVVDAFVGELEPEWVPGEIIVKLREGVDMDTAPSGGLNAGGGFDIKAMLDSGRAQQTSGDEFLIRVVDDFTTMTAEDQKHATNDAIAMTADDPRIEYAQRNYIFQPLALPVDPLYTAQWHYHNNGSGADESSGGINLPKKWASQRGDHSVVIAVLDTGIVSNHVDIQGSRNLVPGFDMIRSQTRANDGDGRDSDPTDPGDGVAFGECGFLKPARGDSWHGTHVSGTVGVGHTNNDEGIAGVAWEVSVQNVRVLGKCGGDSVDINDAIRWAAGLNVPGIAPNPTPAKVINMSLGGRTPCSSTPALQSAINDAVRAGATVVVAAGNSAANASDFYPASCDNVITVAASDFNGHLVGWYSNFGEVVDVMAPGGDRKADLNGDGNPDGVLSIVNNGYEYMNGTSMAAPHVAGVAALLLSQDPNLSPADVESLITSNALPRSTAQCPSPCGAGLLNADF